MVKVRPILLLAPPPPKWIIFLKILALDLEIFFQFIDNIRNDRHIVYCKVQGTGEFLTANQNITIQLSLMWILLLIEGLTVMRWDSYSYT